MHSPFILCPHHLSHLHRWIFPYFRVGPRASSPWPHPLFCVLIWVGFITEHFLILELVLVRVLHAFTLYSVSSSESPSSPNISYFRVGPRASSPCPHPLVCVLIIWVTFINEHFLILELVLMRVLHALYSMISMSSSSESASSPNIKT